ncbi:hypothetical protein LSH36_362g00006 [Paralvinella palmiformis]|uniref:Uncharacterized protein n=1 Tax=Paralvinella palmiformis TaxID=53620 RepID=A0AAD9JE26_9ANNE|nr:hypothetical protein LSH36_362g00006 [Paralvinella palmiformis]
MCSGDYGWLSVLDDLKGFCFYEVTGIRPDFLYCEGAGPCNFKG